VLGVQKNKKVMATVTSITTQLRPAEPLPELPFLTDGLEAPLPVGRRVAEAGPLGTMYVVVDTVKGPTLVPLAEGEIMLALGMIVVLLNPAGRTVALVKVELSMPVLKGARVDKMVVVTVT
jgi:hypothetical protein